MRRDKECRRFEEKEETKNQEKKNVPRVLNPGNICKVRHVNRQDNVYSMHFSNISACITTMVLLDVDVAW